MAVRLTRKGFILIFLAVFILIGGGIGYVAWRVNQQDKLIADEADAGSGSGGTCSNTCSCMVCLDSKGKKAHNGACSASELARGFKGESNCGLHGGCFRVNCQDYGGGWIMTTESNTGSACGGCGWSPTPVPNPGTQTDCSCESYTNSDGRKCGVNCSFPAGTQAKVDAKANETGKPHIAMCRSGGILVIEEFGSGHVCQGLTHICKNPVGEPPETPDTPDTPNVCEGGALITQKPSTPLEVGDSIEVVGYAFDADGVDKSSIQVTLNGTAVGVASSSDACPSGNATVCSQVGSSKKPVVWTYNHTASKEGDDVIQVSWKDSKGNARSACSTSITIPAQLTEIETNPDWELEKSGAGMCVEDNTANPSFKMDYTVTVTNVGDGVGSIDKIVDTLDSKVLPQYIVEQSITPNAVISGNVITWDLSGSDASFNVGQSKTYKYSITIPSQAFGSYTNTVVVTPVDGDAFSDIYVGNANCNIVPGEETPETGVFDEVVARFVAAIVLISVGIGYLYVDSRGEMTFSAVRGVNGRVGREGRIKSSRKKFERRVVK